MATKTTKKEKGPRLAYYLTAKITFITPLLGTSPNNAETYSEYIAKLASDEKKKEEIERLGPAAVDEKGMTVFPRNPKTGAPVTKDYTWQGFLKARGSAIAKIPNSVLDGLAAYLKEVNDLIYITERFPELILPEGKKVITTYAYENANGDPVDRYGNAIGCDVDPEAMAGIKVVDPAHLTPEEIQKILEGVSQNSVDTLERPLRATGPQGERVALSKSETIPIGTTTTITFRCERLQGMDIVKSALNFGFMHGTGQWRNAGYGRFVWECLDKRAIIIDEKPSTEDEFPIMDTLFVVKES